MPLDPEIIRQYEASKSIENIPALGINSNTKIRLEKLESHIDKITNIILEIIPMIQQTDISPQNTINEINHNTIDLCCLPFRISYISKN